MTDAQKKRWWTKRIALYILGLIVMSFGIAMAIRAEIGVPPGGAIAVAAYMFVPLTIGQCSALFNTLCVIIQVIITRRPTLKHLLQLPLAYVFGLMLDFFYDRLDLSLISFWHALFFLVLGVIIFSFGIRAIVGANIVLAPPDGLARTVGNMFGWPMSKSKLIFDIVVTIIAALITLIIGGNAFLVVGIGTVICAIFTGPLIGLYTKLLPFLDTELD
ncbi:MAG: DUF6198 family protein [Oscillospiraceae bacterium]|nr:DUF6198 family protein [Oscillospiraceae bacterium]